VLTHAGVSEMSPCGPSSYFAAKQRFGRFRKKADIKWQVGPASSVANDPKRTFAPARKPAVKCSSGALLCSLSRAGEVRFDRKLQLVAGNMRYQRVTDLVDQGPTSFIRDFGYMACQRRAAHIVLHEPRN
jgi:hypothetical protein